MPMTIKAKTKKSKQPTFVSGRYVIRLITIAFTIACINLYMYIYTYTCACVKRYLDWIINAYVLLVN